MIFPLKDIKNAVIWLDAVNPQSKEAVRSIHEFLSRRGIKEVIYYVNDLSNEEIATPQGCTLVRKRNINMFNRFRRTRRCPVKSGNEDLVINLITRPIKAVDANVRKSPARFKIGRIQSKNGMYDYVQTDAPGRNESRPLDVWTAISHFLSMIQ